MLEREASMNQHWHAFHQIYYITIFLYFPLFKKLYTWSMGSSRVREWGPDNVWVVLLCFLWAFDFQMLGVEMQNSETITITGRFIKINWQFIVLIRIISERENRLTSTCTHLIITKENQAFMLIFFWTATLATAPVSFLHLHHYSCLWSCVTDEGQEWVKIGLFFTTSLIFSHEFSLAVDHNLQIRQ